ncbi:MAG: RagB/SusD family nutrient uptake outer membrane protein [Bacteroidales bacterium]|nr:RagB/SusD family nutrient uptake outer membrane protein [Bacteroidales bacterium]
MKKIIFVVTMVLLGFTSCKDYLDRPNLTSYDESNFWKSETTIRMYAQGAYLNYFAGYGSGFGYGAWGPGYAPWADEDIRTNQWTTTTATSGNGWSFDWVRRHNLMLNRVENSTTISDDAKAHWTGIARFFRAMEYSDLCTTFGNVPYFDREVLATELDELYKDRDPIGLCVTRIIEDFDYAAANVRVNDGLGQLNRDIVMAYMLKRLLYFGTLLKYHNLDQAVATVALNKAKWAAEALINTGRYQISDNYRRIFTTPNTLRGNPEVLFHREYATAIGNHAIVTVSLMGWQQSGPNFGGQVGTTLRAINNYLVTDGLPIKQSPLYNHTPDKYYQDMIQNRDPRLLASFGDTLRVPGITKGGIGFSSTGVASIKLQPVEATVDNIMYVNRNNITACPLMRYGEVLISYAEVMAELDQFTQAIADMTINRLRNRNIRNNDQGEFLPKLPPMVVSGSNVLANGVVIDDPDRDPTVSPLLWEIRRERWAELIFEGQRRGDLKRWKKFSYLKTLETETSGPSDISMGVPFNFYRWGTTSNPGSNPTDLDRLRSAFPDRGSLYLFTPGDSTRIATYNLWLPSSRRNWIDGDIVYERQYFDAIPLDQITLYKEMGKKLTQNPGWQE